jgi:signal transduction histidine kinase
MHFLPILTSGDSPWRLPFSECTAAELVEVLLGEDPVQQEVQAGQLLEEDPALLLWSICRAAERDGSQLKTVSDAAVWLIGRGPLELGRSDCDVPALGSAGDGDDDAVDRRRIWARLTAEGRAAAGCLATSQTGQPPATGRLVQLVHPADRWLGSCGPAVSPGNLEDSCLPPWLVRALVEFELPVSEPTDVEEQRCWRRWCHSLPGAVGRLRKLATQMARLHRLETEFAEQVERQKLAAMRELAYGAGHEINNPLANISTRAQTLMREEPDPERRRRLATINSQAFRAHEMIADMMLFAHPPPLQPVLLDLSVLVDRVVAELGPHADQQGTVLRHARCETGLQVRADPTQLAVALRAVCTNALEALGSGGTVTVVVSDGADAAGLPGTVSIAVGDTGPGIPAEVREHLFDPFFSGRTAGRGLGFGLCKAWRIVTDHGGRIQVADSSPGNTTMVICLPGPG